MKKLLLFALLATACQKEVELKPLPTHQKVFVNATFEDITAENVTDKQSVTIGALATISVFSTAEKGITAKATTKSGKPMKVSESIQYGLYTYIFSL